MLRVARRLALITAILSASCAEPPSKEMNQAQGAIDAARAAGADKFAAAEFTAAVDALKRSEEAVAAGDYRQALSHAHRQPRARAERRQAWPSMAAPTRAARPNAPSPKSPRCCRSAQAQLKDPDIARLNAGPCRHRAPPSPPRRKMLQEARTALKAEDYPAVTKALNGAAAELQAALTAIDAAASPRPAASQALGPPPCDRDFRDRHTLVSDQKRIGPRRCHERSASAGPSGRRTRLRPIRSGRSHRRATRRAACRRAQ